MLMDGDVGFVFDDDDDDDNCGKEDDVCRLVEVRRVVGGDGDTLDDDVEELELESKVRGIIVVTGRKVKPAYEKTEMGPGA